MSGYDRDQAKDVSMRRDRLLWVASAGLVTTAILAMLTANSLFSGAGLADIATIGLAGATGMFLVQSVWLIMLASRGGVDKKPAAVIDAKIETEPILALKPVGSVALEYTDELTGLGNRKRMVEKVNRLINDRKSAGTSTSFTIGMMNLDGMKPINDLYGRDGGDAVLKQAALRLSAAIEGEGMVTRCGGDEFGFIFSDLRDDASVRAKAHLLREVLTAPYDLEGSTVRLSGSFGFAIYPFAGQNFETIEENLNSAVYHAKRGGRGRITVFNQDVERVLLENARMEQALRRAISNNEVRPHFQPIISLKDGKLLGFESLARWIDPELGFVSPARFVPLAEERGIINQLSESLLFQAARTAAEWPSELFLSFNLSSVQLADPGTAINVLTLIERAGFDAKRLELEVTETAMMSDPETAALVIEELHSAGIRISMDDFGTGQSSLGRLREMKLDKVKIDRAFIMAIGEDKPAEHIVRAILEMCAGLDLTVVAEGIEEINQAESLKRYGCHAGQGYLFGKPKDALATMNYIRDFNTAIDYGQERLSA